MQHKINIKGQDVTMIFGYRTLKLITENSKGMDGDISMDVIEAVLLDAITFGIKTTKQDLKVTKEEFVDWLESNYDEAVEAQAALEVFMRTHSKKRVESLKKFGISQEEAEILPAPNQ